MVKNSRLKSAMISSQDLGILMLTNADANFLKPALSNPTLVDVVAGNTAFLSKLCRKAKFEDFVRNNRREFFEKIGTELVIRTITENLNYVEALSQNPVIVTAILGETKETNETQELIPPEPAALAINDAVAKITVSIPSLILLFFVFSM